MIKKMAISALVAGLVLSATAQQAPLTDADREATRKLIDHVYAAPNLAYSITEDLTTEIGPRLAGSDAEARARVWAVDRLTDLGFANIRVEPFTIGYWARRVERAEITAPAPQPLVITALGGSSSTPEGGIEAEVVRFTSIAAMKAAPREAVAGKIVFIDEFTPRTQDGSGYSMGVNKRFICAKDAAEMGAAACLVRSAGTQARRFAHTGSSFKDGLTGPLPTAALSPPDADQIARLLTRGPVRIGMTIEVEVKADVPSGNVIAEIVGRETPEEIVLVACHLDSWDMGTGAFDDAVGCGIVTAAARAVADVMGPPKRTVRIIWFGAEEVSLLGARAYLARHQGSLDRYIVASESDFGAGPVWRFQSRFGAGAMDAATYMAEALAPLGILKGDNNARGGPDVGVLAPFGVPMVTLTQDGTDYFDFHHTPDDTLSAIDADSIRQNVAAYAVFIWLMGEKGWDLRATEQAPAAPVTNAP
jgi:hypothetical protein